MNIDVMGFEESWVIIKPLRVVVWVIISILKIGNRKVWRIS